MLTNITTILRLRNTLTLTVTLTLRLLEQVEKVTKIYSLS